MSSSKNPSRIPSAEAPSSTTELLRNCYQCDTSKVRKCRGTIVEYGIFYVRTTWLDFICIAMVAACIPPVLYMPIFFPGQRLVPMRPPVSPSADFDLSNLMDFGLPPELSFPRKPELLSTWVCGYIVVLSPVAVISLFQIKLKSVWDWHAGTIGILKAVVATTFVQCLLKQFMGGARPYLIEVCKPDLDLLRKRVADAQLFFDITACTGKEREINTALQSFPSGHTANSFAVAIFLALYMNAKLKPFADYGAKFSAYMATVLPLLCSSLIGGSVFISHQHHAHDIIFGMLMGIILGTLAFRSSYASILDFRYNHIPLPPSSIRTRFSYPNRGYLGDSSVNETRHLQMCDWWNPLEKKINSKKESLWLESTKSFGTHSQEIRGSSSLTGTSDRASEGQENPPQETTHRFSIFSDGSSIEFLPTLDSPLLIRSFSMFSDGSRIDYLDIGSNTLDVSPHEADYSRHGSEKSRLDSSSGEEYGLDIARPVEAFTTPVPEVNHTTECDKVAEISMIKFASYRPPYICR